MRVSIWSDSLRVRSDFEGGNATDVEIVAADYLRFRADPGTSPAPLWFYFAIEGAAVPEVWCELRNAAECLGPASGWPTVRPVVSAGDGRWERVAETTYVESRGWFRFRVPVRGPRTLVAYSYPYTSADLERLLTDLPAHLQREELARSRRGRAVPYLRAGSLTAPDQVWVLGRQHAGETPASFAAEGLLREMAGTRGAERRGMAVHLVPLLDLDGACEGAYGKDQAPIDFNRDWSPHPRRPEVAEVLRRLREPQVAARTRLVLDLHASHHGDTACYLFGSGTAAAEPLTSRFMEALAEESPPAIGLRSSDLRTAEPPAGSARQYLGDLLRVPVLTVELSYHLAQSGCYLTPELYRGFGAALARAALRSVPRSA
ncbi:MAG: M14-type cytosolic carboxypeptidase [Armatimonadota bacterium]